MIRKNYSENRRLAIEPPWWTIRLFVAFVRAERYVRQDKFFAFASARSNLPPDVPRIFSPANAPAKTFRGKQSREPLYTDREEPRTGKETADRLAKKVRGFLVAVAIPCTDFCALLEPKLT